MNASIQLPAYGLHVLSVIHESGYEAYAVGGCVRDMVMGITPHDIDITTGLLPDGVQTLFAGYRQLDTGKKHGTVTVFVGQDPVEITTYRTDGTYENHRHPVSVSFAKTLLEDLSRRDFTVNALCFHPLKGIVDPLGGLLDIEHKRIRTIGDGRKRFQEDALRILRGFRFMAQLGFTMTQETCDAARETAALLAHISKERITAEFSRLLLCNNPVPALRLMDTLGILPQLIRKVSEKQFNAISRSQPNLSLRLALLLGDNTEQAYKLLTLPKQVMRTVSMLTSNQQSISADPVLIKQILHQLGTERFSLLLKYRTALGEPAYEAEEAANEILHTNECWSLSRLSVTGRDLIAAGITNGKEIGETLEWLLDQVIRGELLNERTILLTQLKNRS